MLGQIANYCPLVSCTSVVKNSTTIQSAWHIIYKHYGFHFTAKRPFLDFANLHLEADE